MDRQTIFDHRKLEVKRVRGADPEIIELLKKTVLGSEGGMRYIMQNTEERVKSYGDSISFMALYRKGSLTGVIGLCRRTTLNCGTPGDSTYLRYLAVHSAFQTRKAPSPRTERMPQGEESFKQKALTLISDPRYLTGEQHETPPPHVMYAYVESSNERSRNLINQSGYEYIRSFLTVAFSRFNPKRNTSVTKLTPEEEPAMAQLLKEHYRNYCFYTDEFTFHGHRYYVLRRDGEIVAGVSAIPARYNVVNMPGLWGWVMMKVLPFFPWFRRLFRPGEFRYIVLNGIYCRNGSECFLPDLFEAVCAEEGYNTALTWLDDHSELYENLRTNRKMGALNRMLNAKPGLVYASFPGLTTDETGKFYDSPAYISGFDFS